MEDAQMILFFENKEKREKKFFTFQQNFF